MVVVRGLNIFPSMVAAVINNFSELSGNYRIELDQKPPYDRLPLSVELATAAQDSEQLAASIEAAIKKTLGASSRITIMPPNSFELTAGKTRRVVRTYT